MWAFSCSPKASIEQHHEELGRYIKCAARKTFGAPQASPIKGWISAQTWLYLRPVSCLRQLQLLAFSRSRRALAVVCITTWAACVHKPFTPFRRRIVMKRCGANHLPYSGSLGWVAAASVDTCRRAYLFLCRISAVASRSTALLHFAAGRNVSRDRAVHFESLPVSAQKSALDGNIRGTFTIIKKMTGFRLRRRNQYC